MSDLDTIRERHTLIPGRMSPTDIPRCECLNSWPCDTRVVLGALERADAASVDDAAALQEAVAIYDREAAHAKALAEALREIVGEDGYRDEMFKEDLARYDAALAAYDKDHERLQVDL